MASCCPVTVVDIKGAGRCCVTEKGADSGQFLSRKPYRRLAFAKEGSCGSARCRCTVGGMTDDGSTDKIKNTPDCHVARLGKGRSSGDSRDMFGEYFGKVQ